MGLFSWLSGKLRGPSGPKRGPAAHQEILAYLRGLWKGKAPDPSFEERTLRTDFGFTSLNMAEVLLAVIQERGLSQEAALDYIRSGPPLGEGNMANLLERLTILAEQFGEKERMTLLSTGVVGDPSEVFFFREESDNVGFVVRYCKAIQGVGTAGPGTQAPPPA